MKFVGAVENVGASSRAVRSCVQHDGCLSATVSNFPRPPIRAQRSMGKVSADVQE